MERRTLFNIFKMAIEDERKAYNFYLTAAANTYDPAVKEIFEDLAQTEFSHEARLREKYKQLIEGGYVSEDAPLQASEEAGDSRVITSS